MTPGERQSLVRGGVEFQRQGRLTQAIRLFEQVLAASPDDVEALYLLGVARTHRGEYAAAVALLERAQEMAPDAVPVRQAWRAAAAELGRRVVEAEICHAVLPRLRPLVNSSWVPERLGEWHCVLATSDINDRSEALATRVISTLGLASVTAWREPNLPVRVGVIEFDDGAARTDIRPVDAGRRAHPGGGGLVFVGAARSPAAWWKHCRPSSVLLVIDEFQPCEIVDRIRELSSDASRLIAIAYASSDLVRQVALPGRLLGDLR